MLQKLKTMFHYLNIFVYKNRVNIMNLFKYLDLKQNCFDDTNVKILKFYIKLFNDTKF